MFSLFYIAKKEKLYLESNFACQETPTMTDSLEATYEQPYVIYGIVDNVNFVIKRTIYNVNMFLCNNFMALI